MRKKIEPPHLSLFKRSPINIAVVRNERADRKIELTYGLNSVLDELSVNVTKVFKLSDGIPDNSTTLISLTSPMSIYYYLEALMRKPANARVIIGGQGAYGFRGYRHLVDRIMLGRCEDVVDDVVLRASPLPYCYDYSRDPSLKNRYIIRQARRLLKGEKSVGCKGACRFCQYSVTRKPLGTDYSPNSMGYHVIEDRFQNIVAKTGNQTTALDGFSETTRRLVGKPVSDDYIVDKLSHCIRNTEGTMRLKVFQIVGYPWESKESVLQDIDNFSRILHLVKRGNGRIMMLIVVTPFSPEPFTAMERDAANISVNWREVLFPVRRIIDVPHINAFILPQIASPLTLYKRIAVNRGVDLDKLRLISSSKTIDDALLHGGDIHLAGGGYYISERIRVESSLDTPPKV